jgi:hypothetical protein
MLQFYLDSNFSLALNPICRRRFVPQSVTRDIISGVITRMPTPAEKWKDYNAEMKDELFKEFMVTIYVPLVLYFSL